MGCGSAKISHTAGAGSTAHQARGCNAFEEEPTPVYTESKQGRRGSKSSKGSKKSKKSSREGIGKRLSTEGRRDESRPLSQPDLSTRTSISGNSKIRVTLSKDGSLLEVETETLDVRHQEFDSFRYNDGFSPSELDPQPSTSTATNHNPNTFYQGGAWGFTNRKVHALYTDNSDVFDTDHGSKGRLSGLYKYRAHSSMPNIKQYCSGSISSDRHRRCLPEEQHQQQQQQQKQKKKPTGCYCCCGPNISNGGGLATTPNRSGKSKTRDQSRSGLKHSWSQHDAYTPCTPGCCQGCDVNGCTCQQRPTLGADSAAESLESTDNVWQKRKKDGAKDACSRCPIHCSEYNSLHCGPAGATASQEVLKSKDTGDSERCSQKPATKKKASAANEPSAHVKGDLNAHLHRHHHHHHQHVIHQSPRGCANNSDTQTVDMHVEPQRISPSAASPSLTAPHSCSVCNSPPAHYSDIGTQSPVHVRYDNRPSQAHYSNGATTDPYCVATETRHKVCREGGGCEEQPSGATSVQSYSTRETCLSRENSRSSTTSSCNYHPHHHQYHRVGNNNNNGGMYGWNFSRESSLSSDYSSLSAQSTHETIPELSGWNSTSDASHASLRSQSSSERSSAKRRIGHRTKEQILELGKMVANPVDHVVEYEIASKFHEESDFDECYQDDPANLLDIHVHTDFYNGRYRWSM